MVVEGEGETYCTLKMSHPHSLQLIVVSASFYSFINIYIIKPLIQRVIKIYGNNYLNVVYKMHAPSPDLASLLFSLQLLWFGTHVAYLCVLL